MNKSLTFLMILVFLVGAGCTSQTNKIQQESKQLDQPKIKFSTNQSNPPPQLPTNSIDLQTKEMIKNYLIALQNRDIEKAYSYTASIFQEAMTLEQFEKMVNEFSILKDGQNLSFNIDENIIKASIFETDDLVNIKTTLYGVKKEEVPVSYALVNEKGVWKISVIDIVGLLQNKNDKINSNLTPKK